jgi:hypothetical protein
VSRKALVMLEKVPKTTRNAIVLQVIACTEDADSAAFPSSVQSRLFDLARRAEAVHLNRLYLSHCRIQVI